MKKTYFFLVSCILLMLSANAFAQETKINLLDKFEKDWEQEWLERNFTQKPNTMEVETEDDTNRVLRIDSFSSASALWQSINMKPGNRGTISWRWKISRNFSNKINEKSKIGDDYAARVYVVFEPNLVNWKTNAICYVWATKESEGSIYRSPYSKSVGHIVLQSGKKNRGDWVKEERNFIADYKKIFGDLPEMVSAIAIMVDTDNSNEEVETWFDDLSIGTVKKVEKLPSPKMPLIR